MAAASGGQPPESCPDCAPVTDDATVVVPAAQIAGTGTDAQAAGVLALLLLLGGAALLTIRTRARGRQILTR